MLLQRVLFSSANELSDSSMYYRASKKQIVTDDASAITLAAGEEVSFDTYYNIFSFSKWAKYTRVNEVSLHISAQGNGIIELYRQSLSSQVAELLCKYTFEKDDKTDVTIPYQTTIDSEQYVLYFKIRGVSDFHVFSCAYVTDERVELNPVRLALNICTYKRESDLKRNLMMLRKNIFDVESSFLRNSVEVFVTDNASSLNINQISTQFIHVVHNKNVGGSGGFTRGLMEILDANKADSKFTHTIFMDDDIIFDISALERTYVLLQLLKSEYQSACIGGAMLRRDMPHIMNECGARWNGNYGEPIKQGLDLRSFAPVLESEKDALVQYQGWWYCCFPIKLLTEQQLPLPLFIHCDDIEYSLRLFKTFITLNGICVWHEAFNQKRVAFLEYYDLRNALIMNAVLGATYSKKQCKALMLHHVIKNIFQLHYKDTASNFRAVEDFCNGVDWLKNQDGESLHLDIMKLSYLKSPMEKILPQYLSIDKKEKAIYSPVELSEKHKLKYLLTLNGWIAPAKYKLKAPGSLSEFRNYYRAKSALIYFDNQTGYIVQKSWKQAFGVIRQYFSVCKLINKRYDNVKTEFFNRHQELTDISFWKGYLGI